MILSQLQAYLDDHHIKYQVLSHSPAYTAQELAAVEHIPGQQVAKVVMVRKKDTGMPVMLVLPASYKVNLAKLTELTGTEVYLEPEGEFHDLFPGCETGAEPPFGNLFGLQTCVDESLTQDEEIVFNGGTHRQTVRMRYQDFAQLVHPRVARFAQHV